MPASPDREAEYHKWYNDTHLAQILSVEGIVSARRFAPRTTRGPKSSRGTSKPEQTATKREFD